LEKNSHTQTDKQLSPPTSERRLDNPNLFEGDIALQTGSPVPGATPSAVFDSKIWPTKKIPYVITPNVFSMIVYLFCDSLFFSLKHYFLMFSAPSQVSLILNAMQAFKDKTCIEFISRTTEPDYISIIRGSG